MCKKVWFTCSVVVKIIAFLTFSLPSSLDLKVPIGSSFVIGKYWTCSPLTNHDVSLATSSYNQCVLLEYRVVSKRWGLYLSFRLSAAAYSRLEDLKSVSKASLSYAIEHHKVCLLFVTTIVALRDELVTTNNHFQLLIAEPQSKTSSLQSNERLRYNLTALTCSHLADQTQTVFSAVVKFRTDSANIAIGKVLLRKFQKSRCSSSFSNVIGRYCLMQIILFGWYRIRFSVHSIEFVEIVSSKKGTTQKYCSVALIAVVKP